MKKVLLFSSLRKSVSVLQVSIPSWLNLIQEDVTLDFLFFDDNEAPDSKNYVQNYAVQQGVTLANFHIEEKGDYKGQHKWNQKQIDRISEIKNSAIQYALDHNYDYLFLVDADLVLHPYTLAHLISQNKHFIFEVFWTLFFNAKYHKPNAWDYHSWAYYDESTLLKLAKPGVYKIGGGGACTLISKEILSKGLTFSRLPSLNYLGEDRHFCTRAQALGYDTVVDTHYPAYHIFYDHQAEEASTWYAQGAGADFFTKWLNHNWERTVKSAFKKDESFLGKLRSFQYEVRKSFRKHFIR